MSDGTFLVSITGQIEYVDILAPSGTSWHCKYEFVTGADWKIIGGLEAGLSQTSNVVVNGDKVVLNFPLEINFKSTNIYGCKYDAPTHSGPPNRKRNCRAADRAQRLQRDAARGIREGAHASEARCSQAGRFAGQAGGVVAAGVRRIVLWVSA
jgi:hypothetical protein